MTKAKSKAPADKSRELRLSEPEGVSKDRVLSDLISHGVVANAMTTMRFAKAESGDLSLTDMVESLQANGEAANRGDLSAAERMLCAQAVALNAIFSEMARRAAVNMGEYIDAADRYMRLALKAQSQSRATIEALAAIKNPPVVYARQANIANGPQQVNNGAVPTGARAPETGILPNEVLRTSSLCEPDRTAFGPKVQEGRIDEVPAERLK
jgi:hypothetical protein